MVSGAEGLVVVQERLICAAKAVDYFKNLLKMRLEKSLITSHCSLLKLFSVLGGVAVSSTPAGKMASLSDKILSGRRKADRSDVVGEDQRCFQVDERQVVLPGSIRRDLNSALMIV